MKSAKLPGISKLADVGISRARFLAAFSQTGNLALAAKIAGVCREVHYHWLQDAAYCAKYAEAQQVALENLEAEAYRRAVEGVVEPVFGSAGRGLGTVKVGEIRKYSDQLLMFLLRGRAPEKYRERMDHKHTGTASAGVSIQEIMDLLDAREAERMNVVDAETVVSPASELLI